MRPLSDFSTALVIFTLAYAVIVTERVHKTIVALCGAALMIVSGVLTQEEAFYSHEFGVDYNVVFLLIGMMVIVNIVRETGLFEVLAIWSAQRAGAEPFRMLALLALVTAVLSAMLDNVTTVLLMAPVTLSITKRLELRPVPFLIVEAMASNIGGTATLIGDPPNILIGSAARIDFATFHSHPDAGTPWITRHNLEISSEDFFVNSGPYMRVGPSSSGADDKRLFSSDRIIQGSDP